MKKLSASQVLKLLESYNTRVSICIDLETYSGFSESIEDINSLKSYFNGCEIEELSKDCFVVKLYEFNFSQIEGA